MTDLRTKYYQEIRPKLKEELGLKNIMQVPSLEKIVLNVGMASAVSSPKGLEVAREELSLITGQYSVKTKAHKSIAAFKLRAGVAIGAKVTLRSQRMFAFLEKLIYVALPRVRDFAGLNPKSFDAQSNYNLSIKEQIIFPEIDVDKVDSYHGINISFVTTATDRDANYALLKSLGLPLREK